jgi:hypothetical protein
VCSFAGTVARNVPARRLARGVESALFLASDGSDFLCVIIVLNVDVLPELMF